MTAVMITAANARIAEAAKDDAILQMTVSRAAARFRITPDEVQEARAIAMATWGKSRIARVVEGAYADKLKCRAIGAEFYHPGMLRRRVVEQESCASVAAAYHVSPSFVHKIDVLIRKLATILSRTTDGAKTVAAVVAEVERAARAPGAEESINKPRGLYAGSAEQLLARRAAQAHRKQ